MSLNENYLRSMLIILFANRKMAILLFLFFCLLTVFVAFYMPPIYEIKGALIVKSKKIQSPPESTTGTGYRIAAMPPSREDVISEIEIVTSHDLIQLSINELKKSGMPITPTKPLLMRALDNYIITPLNSFVVNPLNKYLLKPILDLMGIVTELEAIDDVMERTSEIEEIIEAVVLPGSNVIQVSFMYGDPLVGSSILNSIFNNYLHYRLSLFSSPSQKQFFTDQMMKIEREIEINREKHINLLRQFESSDINKDIDVNMNLVEKLRRDIQSLEQELVEKRQSASDLDNLYEAHITTSTGVLYAPFPYDFNDTEIDRYAERLSNLLFDYHESLRVFHSNTEKMKIMEEEIKNLKSIYHYMIRSYISQKKKEIDHLSRVIDEKNKSLSTILIRSQDLKKADVLMKKLNDKMDLLNENYKTFFNKAEESNILQTSEITQLSNVQIISYSSIPDEPFFPQKKIVIPIGFLIGFILSITLAYIKEFFDHTFKTPEHISRYLGVPVIGYILYKK